MVLCASPNGTNTESSEVTDKNVTESSAEPSTGGSGNNDSKHEELLQPETYICTEGNQHEGQQMQSNSGGQSEDPMHETKASYSKIDRPREGGCEDSDGTNDDVQKVRKPEDTVTAEGSSVDEAPDTASKSTPDGVKVEAANTTNPSKCQTGEESDSEKPGAGEGSSNKQNHGAVTRRQSEKKDGKPQEKEKTKADTNKNKSDRKKNVSIIKVSTQYF